MTPHALRTILIENLTPAVDDGRYPIKREVGDSIRVEADIFKEGHEQLRAVVMYRRQGELEWAEASMAWVDNDRWAGTIVVSEVGRYQYTVQAWTDAYGSWLAEVRKKHDAGEPVQSEMLEGLRIVRAAQARASTGAAAKIGAFAAQWQGGKADADRIDIASEPDLVAMMRAFPDRSRASTYDRMLEVVVDPVLARFGAWYEIFPRSQGTDPSRGSTFRQCERRLEEIRGMGFDVLYMPPIHPIGVTNRKGKNNAVVAQPGDPGSPYAIGGQDGGHDAVEPALGTMADFDHFVQACKEHGLQVALDFAIQCSPDHPYVTQHPEWFFKRLDGTIKYAENPPKKYQDIYPLDFYCEAWQSLWQEMLRILEFWYGHGVRIFRVDNPHTKPVRFWKWLISTAKERHPDMLFFAEAFTRPKMMRALAKAGFSQSYTYFTWRNTKQELTEYMTELTQGEMKEYFRGNFFTNTPDILPFFLQTGGRAAFKIRAVLASTLSSCYGIYSGFELCESKALPGREEYADSEKYEHKVWDWDRPGNIKALLTILNRARQTHPALQEYDNLKLFWSDNDDILVYGKMTPDKKDVVLVVINLNPRDTRATMVHIPPSEIGVGDNQPYGVHDLITDQKWVWRGWNNYVRLDPNEQPAHLLVVSRQ